MSKKALVVEDDINIAELLMLYLEKDGFGSALRTTAAAVLICSMRYRPTSFCLTS